MVITPAWFQENGQENQGYPESPENQENQEYPENQENQEYQENQIKNILDFLEEFS